MTHFAIIGGGIAGLSAAAALAPHGDVTVLEAEDTLAHHASSRSAAVFVENYGNATVRALNTASLPYLKDHNILTQKDFILVAKATQKDAFLAEAASFEAKQITLAEAQSRFPILDTSVVAHAAHYDDIYDMDTDLMVQGYARAARASGATIRTQARVTALSQTTTGWQVATETDSLQATHIVNAAGAWADQIAALAGVKPIGLQPYRRSMARLAAPGGLNTKGWAMVDGVGESWYAKPDAGALLVSPSEEDPMDPFDAWPDDMVLAEGLARYQDHVTEPVTKPIATWAGLRSFAPDRALVIGPDPDAPGFLWLAGQGGYGFQTAPAAADLLKSLALGTAPNLGPAITTALSPARFR